MLPRCAATPTSQRRQPEQTVLYRTVQAHLETFLAQTAGDAERSGVPGFVKREFEAYLRCGILRHGFTRLRCANCAFEHLLPFSCKRRGYAEWWNMRSTEAAPGATLRRVGAVPLMRGVRDFA